MKRYSIRHICGQAAVELAIITPLFLLLLMLGADFGRLGFQQHKVIAASYEGTKIVSQVEPPFFLECYTEPQINDKINILRSDTLKEINKIKKTKGEREIAELPKEVEQELAEWQQRKTLCQVLEERAREVLIRSGLPAQNIVMLHGGRAIPDIDQMDGKTFVRFAIEPNPADAKPGEVIYVGVEVAMPFSYFIGRGIGFQNIRLTAKLMTYFSELEARDNDDTSQQNRVRCGTRLNRFGRALVDGPHSGSNYDDGWRYCVEY